MRTARMRHFFWAGSVLSIVIVAACSDAFWDDPSLSLRSGLGDDPVLDIVIAEGAVVSLRGDVVTGGQWSQHPSHIALTRGDVFDVRDVMPDTTRGATIAYRFSVAMDHETAGSSTGGLCSIAALYRPRSPVRLVYIVPLDRSTTDWDGNVISDDGSFRQFGLYYGTQPDTDPFRPMVPSAHGPGSGPHTDAPRLEINQPRWAAVTLDRNGGVSFYLEGAFLQNTSMWSLTEFSREFGALALIPSTSCDIRSAEWMRDTEFDPVQNPIESAGASSPFTFEISAIRVFDYALTNDQLERLPDL